MGVRIDQAGKDYRLTKVLGRDIGRAWHARTGSDSVYLAIGRDQERASLYRSAFNRNQPAGRQPARPHVSEVN
jgi:hypothetical protein